MDPSDMHTDGNGKKLRSTCDRCAALKVRCNKQKPKCERCETSQEKCVYGPYRWKGRPASNKTAAAQHQQHQHQHQHQPPSSHQQPLPTQPRQLSQPQLRLPTSNTGSPGKFLVPQYSQPPETPNVYIDPADMQQQYPGWEDLQVPPGFGPLGSELAQPWTSPQPQVPVDLDFIVDTGMEDAMLIDPSVEMGRMKCNGVGSGGGNGELHENVLYSRASGPTTPNFDFNQGYFKSPTLSSMSSPPVGQHECRRLVMELLQGLSQIAPRCNPAGVEPSYFSSTRIMKVNRSAIQTLENLLNKRCSSCLLGGELSLLLRSECSIMLGRYRDVFRSIAQLPGPSDSNVPPLSSSGTSLSHSPSSTPPDAGTPRSVVSGHHHSRSESISFDPVQFSDFKLDYLTERTMNAHLLLSELRNLDRVLAKIRGVEMDAHPPEPTVRLIGGVQEAFHGFLEASMADLKSQIEQFCGAIA